MFIPLYFTKKYLQVFSSRKDPYNIRNKRIQRLVVGTRKSVQTNKQVEQKINNKISKLQYLHGKYKINCRRI